MSFEPLPQNLEQGVQRFAQQQRVSHDEAVLMLIETGLKSVPTPTQTETMKNPGGDQSESEATSVAVFARRRNLKIGPQPPLRTDNPEKIMGLFAHAPEVSESILHVVEARSERYMGNA
jgi:hypothetical protein